MPTTAKPSLPDLQGWMRWVLTHPAGAGDVIAQPHRRAALPKHWTRGSEPTRLLPVIGQSADVSQATRLAIYGDGYFIRIVGVLAANFSVVRAIIGAHDFDDHVGRDYLVKHPSVHKCIDNIGDSLPVFLKTHSHTKHLPFLPDLARLEWAYHESFYSDEWPPLNLVKLKSAPLDAWETAVVTLDPSVRLLDLSFPIVQLWRDDGDWSPDKRQGLKETPSPVLVYRNDDGDVRVSEQTPGALVLLRALQSGKPFGAALRSAARKGVGSEEAMPLFQQWTARGIIRKVAFR